MIRGSDAGSATVVRPTTAKLSRPQIMDPSWSLNIDMTTIQLSTLEEVETVLTKPRRLHLQATVAAATKKRGGRKSVARPLGNNSSTNKKITSNKIPVAVDFLPQEVSFRTILEISGMFEHRKAWDDEDIWGLVYQKVSILYIQKVSIL